MSGMTLVNIVTANDPWATALQTFGEAMIRSDWWSVGAEYGVGPALSLVQLTGPAITANLDGPGVVAYIQELIANGGPQPNGQTLYLLYLPDGISLTDAPPTACAYHDAFPGVATSLGDTFGVVSRCAGTQSPSLENVTTAASHEVMEAATDPLISAYTLGQTLPAPWLRSVWGAEAVGGSVEVGDLCEGTRVNEPGGDGGETYQRIWSNAAADAGGDPCLPHLAVPYFNVSAPQDWYAVDGGRELEILVTGWSTGVTNDWLLYAGLQNSSPGFGGTNNLAVTSPLGLKNPMGCMPAPGINNGIAATVRLPLPAELAPGDFAVVGLYSVRVDQSCAPVPGDDEEHVSYVGVYVPVAPGCGLDDFTLACPNNSGFCPLNSSCVESRFCSCGDGYVDLDCSGEPCRSVDGGCQYPNWWCAPLQPGACGAQNDTVTCASGAGTIDCPTNSTCDGQGGCQCAAGFSAIACDGSACDGGCSYPNWWCH